MVLFVIIVLLVIGSLSFWGALKSFNTMTDMVVNDEDLKSAKYKNLAFQGPVFVFLATIVLSLDMVLIFIPVLRIYLFNFLKL